MKDSNMGITIPQNLDLIRGLDLLEKIQKTSTDSILNQGYY